MTTGDFLFDLIHTQMAFCLIVGKWHTKICHETHRLFFLVDKPIKKILSGPLFFSPPCSFLYFFRAALARSYRSILGVSIYVEV